MPLGWSPSYEEPCTKISEYRGGVGGGGSQISIPHHVECGAKRCIAIRDYLNRIFATQQPHSMDTYLLRDGLTHHGDDHHGIV